MATDPTSLLIVGFALLTFKLWQVVITGYWEMPYAFFPSTDILGEAHRQRLAKIKQRFLSTWTLPLCLTAVAFALTPWWRWESVDHHNLLRPIILITSGILSWKAITMDVNLVTGKAYPGCRILMLFTWVGAWVHPGFLILLLHTGITWLRSNYHHQHLAIRIIIMFLAYLGALPLLSVFAPYFNVGEHSDSTAAILFLFLCITASHYLLPGYKKLSLGPHPHSWMIDNQMHKLTISAYLWGWLRFLPAAKAMRLACKLRPFDRIFQLGTLVVELGAIFILLDHRICLCLLVSFIVFQCLVFASSGIFFWPFMVVNAALIWSVWNLPESIITSLFGWESTVLCALIIFIFPARKKIWAPQQLGWWDTSFIGRVHYEVKGKSGTWYGLYNDFMCPDEKIFGQTYGDFLSKEKRITKHIGETAMRERFDAIQAVGTDLSKLEEAKQQWGRNRYDPNLEATLDQYLTTFIRQFNAGHRKRIAPCWLKAPGGQWFHWGKLPRFKGQEPIDELVVHYREHYFDGDHIHLLIDQPVKTLTF